MNNTNLEAQAGTAKAGISKKNALLSTWMGIGATWFGVHMGPGTASGRQGATYYSAYGTWGFFTPFIAMAILGVVVYIVVEYMRRNDLNRYSDFFNHFFSPHEKAFSIIFDVLYFFTYFMIIGAALFTGGQILADQSGMPYLLSVGMIAGISLFLIIYGQNIVRIANSFMTWIMLLILVFLMIFALQMPGNAFTANMQNPELAWNMKLLLPALWSAVVYASFQVTGCVGSVASVTDGLENRKESKKAAVFGMGTNAVLLMMIAIMQFGLQPYLTEQMPNYAILQALNKPVLYWGYVILVELAVISSIIGMNNGVATRVEKYVKINKPIVKNLVINIVFLGLAAFVSMAGLTAIVNVGFRYLGYANLPLVIIPILFIGIKKVFKNQQELPDTAAKEHLGK